MFEIFLGIEIAYSLEDIFISQRKYILDLLKETKMEECKPFVTPINPNLKLGACEKEKAIDKGQHQRLIAKLIYLKHAQLNISFTMGLLSQFMQSPRKSHIEATFKLLAYIKGIVGYGIVYHRGKKLELKAYTCKLWGICSG